MTILTLRTDKPEAELGLYDDQKQIVYETWEAHRQLAETIHQQTTALLKTASKTLEDIEGIVVYAGPGSFTGLRIGISVANALAYSLKCPIIAESDDWIENGITQLLAGKSDKIARPEYGSPAHTTSQRK